MNTEENALVKGIKNNLLGILLALAVTILGIYGAELLGDLLIKMNLLPEGGASPISGIFVAFIIGIILRNLVGLHEVFRGGIAFSLMYAIRFGVILLGLRLRLAEAFNL